ncbi:DinB family protein [Olivibacter sp. SDN3]|uniref:DinB family protein n=1 Tax=Olivibacter sp. SDN3 TaxID=2764720 RepID=UPI001650F10E|nr:DinB family protein [Olivibacter sp. SDN3]QNL47827.1 DinB family protein [Olivibacter sp. SDN3]
MDNSIIITTIIVSQYKAGLGMLRQAIEKIPLEQWNNEEYNNPNWQIAYHILWGVKFYLGANPECYIPWENAIDGAESLGGSQDWENPDEGVVVEGSHTKEELFAFIDDIENNLQHAVETLPLDQDSGFEWYPYTRLELHINSIRHIQHHTAQLIERQKEKRMTGFPWWADQNPPQEW